MMWTQPGTKTTEEETYPGIEIQIPRPSEPLEWRGLCVSHWPAGGAQEEGGLHWSRSCPFFPWNLLMSELASGLFYNTAGGWLGYKKKKKEKKKNLSLKHLPALLS